MFFAQASLLEPVSTKAQARSARQMEIVMHFSTKVIVAAPIQVVEDAFVPFFLAWNIRIQLM